MRACSPVLRWAPAMADKSLLLSHPIPLLYCPKVSCMTSLLTTGACTNMQMQLNGSDINKCAAGDWHSWGVATLSWPPQLSVCGCNGMGGHDVHNMDDWRYMMPACAEPQPQPAVAWSTLCLRKLVCFHQDTCSVLLQ